MTEASINKPEFLYKYHRLNMHLMEMLTNAELYMSKKADLNDPLDLAYDLTFENYLSLYLKKYPSFKGDQEQLDRVKFLFDYRIERGENDIASDLDDLLTKTRVCCFTEDGNNPLMWSHYADNHNGVCLKFKPSNDTELNSSLQKVNYLDRLVEIKELSDFPKSLLTKLNVWSIEKEWRILSEKERFRFKQEAIVEIILGLNTSDKTMNWFKQFAENVYYYHAPINRLAIRGSKIVKVDHYGDEISEESINLDKVHKDPFLDSLNL